MTLCADSAFPAGLEPFPTGYKCAQFYIGERLPIRTPTPHIWDRNQINRLPKGIGKYPMFVGTPAIGESGDAETEALECLKALKHVECPLGKVVGLDLELAVAPAYVTAFGGVLNHFGMRVWVYGSLSTVFRNPRLNGYDPADWTGLPHVVAGAHATQWASAGQLGTTYDARSIRFWQFKRHIWR